jgi:hypothetical protein
VPCMPCGHVSYWKSCYGCQNAVSRIGQPACYACCLHTLQKASVPCVPGSLGLIKDEADCLKVVGEIGLPVMIKATAGMAVDSSLHRTYFRLQKVFRLTLG